MGIQKLSPKKKKKERKTLPIVFEIRVNRSFTEVSTKDKKTATIE